MIYTTYFAKMRSIREKRPKAKFVSIAGKCPDWYKNGLEYKKLAPKYDWWKEWHDKFADDLQSEESKQFYAERYQETVLSTLNPHSVKADLYSMANSRDVFIMCYETPDKFCHRQLVCDWLNENGIHCCEWDDSKADSYGPFARVTLRDQLSPYGKVLKTIKSGLKNIPIAEDYALSYADSLDVQAELGHATAVKKMVTLSADVIGLDFGSKKRFIVIDFEEDS